MFICTKMKTMPLALLAAILLVISCKKNTEQADVSFQQPPVSVDSMQRCHNLIALDSAAIRSALLNQWNWEFIKCYWNPEDANGSEYKGLSILFKANDSLELMQNSTVIQRAHWQLSRLGDGYFKLVTNPFVIYLPGKVMLCNNRLLMYDTYVDGCDNYFTK